MSSHKWIKFTCSGCGKSADTTRSNYNTRRKKNRGQKLYCSRKCVSHKNPSKPTRKRVCKSPVLCICASCDKEFLILGRLYKKRTAKNISGKLYCSRQCFWSPGRKTAKHVDMVCHTCRKPFSLKRATQRHRLRQKGLPHDAPNDSLYCSKSCSGVDAAQRLKAEGKFGGRKPNKTGDALQDEWNLKLHAFGLGEESGKPRWLLYGHEEKPPEKG